MKQHKATYTELYKATSNNWKTATKERPALRYTLEHWQSRYDGTDAYIVRREMLTYDSYIHEPVREPDRDMNVVKDFTNDEQALRWIVRHTEREFAEAEGYEPQDETEDEHDA